MKHYRLIEENSVVSEHYEIKRLIRGNIDKILYYKNANILLVLSGKILWKISRDGYVEDTLESPGGMQGSGLSLLDEGYVDWVYTGERRVKTYPKIVDARGLGDRELFAMFDRSQVVEFGTSGEGAFAYLWSDGNMKVLDISDRREKVDTTCDRYTASYFYKIHWDRTCLEGYEKKYNEISAIQEGEPLAWPGSTPDRVHVDGFNRTYYYFEGGFFWWIVGNILVKTALIDAPMGPPTSYWYGNVSISLSHDGEELRFKTPGYKEERGIYTAESWLYDLNPVGDEALTLIQISSTLASDGKVQEHFQNVPGLYAVRPRISGRPEDANETNVASIASSGEVRVRTPWSLTVSGFPWQGSHFESPISGEVRFSGKNNEKRNFVSGPFSVENKFYVLPESLKLRFKAFSTTGSAFRIETDEGGSVYWFYHPGLYQELHFELQYDSEELKSAFRQLERSGRLIHLETHMELANKSMATLSFYLRQGDKSIPLKKTHLQLEEPAFDGNQEKELLLFQQSQLKIEFLRAKENPEVLRDFIDLAKKLTADRSNGSKLREEIDYFIAQLLHTYINQKTIHPARELALSYLEIVPPGSRHTSNTSVVAANMLHVSALTQDEKLAKDVFEKVLEPHYRMETESYPILLFNIACYHSLHGHKEKMLVAMRYALQRGKKPEEFLTDEDFRNYREDPDFLELLSSFRE